MVRGSKRKYYKTIWHLLLLTFWSRNPEMTSVRQELLVNNTLGATPGVWNEFKNKAAPLDSIILVACNQWTPSQASQLDPCRSIGSFQRSPAEFVSMHWASHYSERPWSAIPAADHPPCCWIIWIHSSYRLQPFKMNIVWPVLEDVETSLSATASSITNFWKEQMFFQT